MSLPLGVDAFWGALLQADGGCVVAVFGGRIPWDPQYEPERASQPEVEGAGTESTVFEAALTGAQTAEGTTQLQLTFDSIIIDRYDLTADDVAAMREEILGVHCVQ